MLLTDPVVEVIRRELRRVSPDVRIDLEQIREVLSNEVIKREVVEGEKAEETKREIARSAGKALRTVAPRSDGTSPGQAVPDLSPPAPCDGQASPQN